MLGEQARDRRRDSAPPGVRQHEVADLDDLALGVEMVQRAAPDDLAAASVNRRKRQEAPRLRKHRQLAERGDEPVPVECRKVAGLAQLRIHERRQDRVDVIQSGKAQDHVACADPLGRYRQA